MKTKANPPQQIILELYREEVARAEAYRQGLADRQDKIVDLNKCWIMAIIKYLDSQ